LASAHSRLRRISSSVEYSPGSEWTEMERIQCKMTRNSMKNDSILVLIRPFDGELACGPFNQRRSRVTHSLEVQYGQCKGVMRQPLESKSKSRNESESEAMTTAITIIISNSPSRNCTATVFVLTSSRKEIELSVSLWF
jgi:hypothetical protein